MKKFILALLAVCLMACLLCSCKDSKSKDKETLDITGCWQETEYGFKIWYYDDGTFSQNGVDKQGTYKIEGDTITETLDKVGVPKEKNISLDGDILTVGKCTYAKVSE